MPTYLSDLVRSGSSDHDLDYLIFDFNRTLLYTRSVIEESPIDLSISYVTNGSLPTLVNETFRLVNELTKVFSNNQAIVSSRGTERYHKFSMLTSINQLKSRLGLAFTSEKLLPLLDFVEASEMVEVISSEPFYNTVTSIINISVLGLDNSVMPSVKVKALEYKFGIPTDTSYRYMSNYLGIINAELPNSTYLISVENYNISTFESDLHEIIPKYTSNSVIIDLRREISLTIRVEV